MAILLSPIGNSVHYIDSNGIPLVGAQLFVYEAGSSTKAVTFKDNLGASNNTNPIILDGSGATPFPVWVTSGASYKFILAPATDIDPPTAAIWSIDNVVAINDTSISFDQWVTGPVPTFVSTTSFSLVGDQTTEFHIGRRGKMSQTSGTVYGVITDSTFLTVTTVTVALDSGVLDSGIDAVWYGILTSDGHSVPFGAMYTATGDILYGSAPSVAKILPIGNDGQLLVASVIPNSIPSWWAPSGYRSGLILSPDIGDPVNDINITAGEATDSGAGYIMKLTNELTKQLDNPWSAGDNSGGNFTATLDADTWYHIHLIRKDSDGSIDAGFDTSLTATNIPAGYTAYLRIGSILTDATSAILAFKQIKDLFFWKVPIVELSSPVARDALLTLSTPLGVDVIASLHSSLFGAGGDTTRVYISDTNRGSDSLTEHIAANASSAPTSTWLDVWADQNSEIWVELITQATSYSLRSLGWRELW